MTTAEALAGDRLGDGDLVAELLALTPAVGPNETGWPGLTAYRFSRPQPPQWAEVHSVALCCVVQGRKRFVVAADEHVCAPGQYLLFARGMRFEAEILEASVDEPYLSFVLQIDPAVVSSVLDDMVAGEPTPSARASARPSSRPAEPPATLPVSPFGHELWRAVARFLASLASASDRRVLTPMILREITYRVMQADPASRLLHEAAMQHRWHPVSRVARYVREHMAEPITVADMAEHAQMSTSALTTLFVGTTGLGPYQYAKRMRLNRARLLLLQGGLTVSTVAREVGYPSASYFINEFKRQFGTTPRAYARAQRDAVAMRVEEATERRADAGSVSS